MKWYLAGYSNGYFWFSVKCGQEEVRIIWQGLSRVFSLLKGSLVRSHIQVEMVMTWSNIWNYGDGKVIQIFTGYLKFCGAQRQNIGISNKDCK